MLRHRSGASDLSTDPRSVLSSTRALKAGSTTYLVLNCSFDDIIKDEDICKLLAREVCIVTAMFSAQYVLEALYELTTPWALPLVRCVYPYDAVPVDGYLIHTLDICMQRVSTNACTVRWGGDKTYTEPYTTTAEYRPFAEIYPSSEALELPEGSVDEAVRSV